MATPVVGIIMGSRSDWGVMESAGQTLDELGIAYEAKVVSAHRTPDRLYEYAKSVRARGLKAIIAGAGGAARADEVLLSIIREGVPPRAFVATPTPTGAALRSLAPAVSQIDADGRESVVSLVRAANPGERLAVIFGAC